MPLETSLLTGRLTGQIIDIMKRALAERAKQQKQKEQADNLLNNNGRPSGGVGTPSTLSSISTLGSHVSNNGHSSSPFLQQQQIQQQQMMQQEQDRELLQQQQSMDMRVEPPRKIPRIKSSSSPRTPNSKTNPSSSSTNTKKNKLNGARNKTSTNDNTAPNNNTSTPNPKKRSRPSSSGGGVSSSSTILRSPLPLPTAGDEEDDDDEATNTKFFLRHQNRALASELYKYKHAITVLERERNVRREECKLINGVLRDIVSNWNGMEGVLLGALESGVSFIFLLFVKCFADWWISSFYLCTSSHLYTSMDII